MGSGGWVDPLAADFPSWCNYTYTFNNPLIYTDPDGRSPLRIAVSVGRIGWRAWKMRQRYGSVRNGGGIKEVLRAEAKSIKRDGATLFGKGVKFGARVKALVDLVVGTDLNSAPEGTVTIGEPTTVSFEEETDEKAEDSATSEGVEEGRETSKERTKTLTDLESSLNQLEGIENAQDAAKKEKKGKKQNKIQSIEKSKQKFKNATKNLDIDDLKNFEF